MKKAFAKLIAACWVLPLLLRYALLARFLGAHAALTSVSERAAGRPGQLGIYIRQALYRRLLLDTGQDIHFGYQSVFSKPAASIGDRVYFGRFCTVGLVTIGDDVKIADGAQLLSGSHHHGTSSAGVESDTIRYQKIRIGKGAWIGANAVVMADVGEGAIVGAGAVVTKPVADGVVVGGVPAKPLQKAEEQSRRAA